MKARTVIYLILGGFMFMYLVSMGAYLAYGHEGGHANGIYHLEKGETTPPITRSEKCPGQNKVLLYHDVSDYDMYDVCTTMWVEHGKTHIIVTRADPDGVCECQGYLWLFDDSQEGQFHK